MEKPVIIIRSKRRTIAISVRDGVVEVRAPLKMSRLKIDKIVASKEKWIANNLAHSRERLARRESFTLAYGEPVTYRGKLYPIIAKEGGHAGFDGERFYMPPGLTQERIKYACVQIYSMLAKCDLTEKVFAFAKRMSVAPVAVKINSAKTHWGSCSAKKRLNFSWRLIMADDDVINYIVVHELAHITEMNHSKRFWAIVKGVLPDYLECEAKLKELQRRLDCEGWEI